MRKMMIVWGVFAMFLGSCSKSDGIGATDASADAASPKARDASSTQHLALPPAGQLYHGVQPNTPGNDADDALAPEDVDSYVQTIGHRVVWVYFNHDWAHGVAFPQTKASWIRARGSIPFVRLMLRSTQEPNVAEVKWTLAKIAAGQFDSDLGAWADAARAFATPLPVEFGTEMNGEWFPWNTKYNGGGSVGTAAFVAAYRHIVDVMRAHGATNIIWVFHSNGQDVPPDPDNHFEHYYPGDSYVDWVGISQYGAITPNDVCPDFATALDTAVPRLAAMAPGKPAFVFEMGVTENATNCDSVAWADSALQALVTGRWRPVRGFSWLNSAWGNGGSLGLSDMRVQDSAGITAAFMKALGAGATLDRPILQ